MSSYSLSYWGVLGHTYNGICPNAIHISCHELSCHESSVFRSSGTLIPNMLLPSTCNEYSVMSIRCCLQLEVNDSSNFEYQR